MKLIISGAAVISILWGGVTFGLDSRYVAAGDLKEVVRELRRDRIQAALVDVESQIALITLAATYADTPEWEARRRGEKEILEQKKRSLERDLELK